MLDNFHDSIDPFHSFGGWLAFGTVHGGFVDFGGQSYGYFAVAKNSVISLHRFQAAVVRCVQSSTAEPSVVRIKPRYLDIETLPFLVLFH